MDGVLHVKTLLIRACSLWFELIETKKQNFGN